MTVRSWTCSCSRSMARRGLRRKKGELENEREQKRKTIACYKNAKNKIVSCKKNYASIKKKDNV